MTSITATRSDSYAKEGGHWYTKTGKPMYEVPNASNPGTMRPTTIRDARKLDLVPSATTIMKLEAKPQLVNWLVQQGMLACLTLPRNPGEDDTQFIKRALDDSKQQVYKAAERGTFLHGLIEAYFKRDTVVASPEDMAWVKPAIDWIEENFQGYKWSAESSFAWAIGGNWYGGKRDLVGTHESGPPVVIDYKCKDFAKGSEKKLAYDEHVTQLAAYGDPLMNGNWQEFRAVNLFVSTKECGHFVPVEWEWSDIEDGQRAFECLANLWYVRNRL
jgi:hypothetical protein